MTTLAEARAELAQIAERQAALQKIVDAAPRPLLAEGSDYTIGAEMKADWVVDRAVRDAYADALDTLLMLRHQPGTEAAQDDIEQFVIECSGGDIFINSWTGLGYKVPYAAPCFSTRICCQAAIDTIGAARILRMFRTLHGVA